MPIPDYQSCMLPLIRLASDGHEHVYGDVTETLAQQFQLTEQDRRELLPSGQEPRFDNRVGWAITYLKKAGLLERRGRGRFRITQRGMDVLNKNPATINTKFLRQFPEFLEFQRKANNKQDGTHSELTQSALVQVPSAQNRYLNSAEEAPDEVEPHQTPQEVLDASYQSLRRTLAQDLLDRVKASPPRFFENLVVDLLVTMGYGGSKKDAGQAVGQSGDGGIDGIIKEDKLGLDAVYIQAKRWEGTVGRPVVQAFAGSLEGQRARKGVLITTSQFSPEAKDYVTRIEKRIVLIDGEQLAQLMIDYGIGVAEVATYTVKRVDSDYFGEE